MFEAPCFEFYLVDFGECLWVIPVRFAFWKIANTSLAELQRESWANLRAGLPAPGQETVRSAGVGGGAAGEAGSCLLIQNALDD